MGNCRVDGYSFKCRPEHEIVFKTAMAMPGAYDWFVLEGRLIYFSGSYSAWQVALETVLSNREWININWERYVGPEELRPAL